jgi:hypothetical protein
VVAEPLHHGELKMMIGGKRAASVVMEEQDGEKGEGEGKEAMRARKGGTK